MSNIFKYLKLDKSCEPLLSSLLTMPILLVLCRYYNLYKVDILQNKLILYNLIIILNNHIVQSVIIFGFSKPLHFYINILFIVEVGYQRD